MLDNVSVITKLNVWIALMFAALAAMAGLGLQAQHAALPAGAQASMEPAWWMGALLLVAGGAGVWLRLEVRKGILRSIRAAAHVIERAAEGDLTARVQIKAYGETQKMLQGLEKMTRDLGSLVSEVSHSARTVADTSAQIAQGNLDLSQRTEEQASTLEETASSMEELTSTVAHNADNARQASRLAAQAAEVAAKGGAAVGEVVVTMTGITESSRRIGDIIGVIDGIAFQTNILALNAAVEAARAGDQGRGFAVVASVVRSLAQRSAAAAKEIKGLIGDSLQNVDTGSRQVNAAGATMQEIVESVRQVSALIAEIAAASAEQSSGIGQVNTAITQMEQVVQQNASLVEEATAATESLREQAGVLLHAVSRFKVEGTQHVMAAQRPVAPAAPAPIQVRRSPKRSPAYAAIPAYAARPDKHEWEEF
jgi:methyl-accepting chemotaxis protein